MMTALGTGRMLITWGVAWLAAFVVGAASRGVGTWATVVAIALAIVMRNAWRAGGKDVWRGYPNAGPLPERVWWTSICVPVAVSLCVIGLSHGWRNALVVEGGYWPLAIGVGASWCGWVYGGVYRWLGLALVAVWLVLLLGVHGAVLAMVFNGVVGGSAFIYFGWQAWAETE